MHGSLIEWSIVPGYPWALGDVHLGTLEVNFFVYWAIFKISKPTTISGEYVIFLTKLTHWILLATPEYL